MEGIIGWSAEMIPDSQLKRGSGHKAELSNTINIKDGCLRLWALTYIQKKEKSASGAEQKDQPFIPSESSALSFLIQAGDF